VLPLHETWVNEVNVKVKKTALHRTMITLNLSHFRVAEAVTMVMILCVASKRLPLHRHIWQV